jgi:hypothetical protein
VRASEKAFTDAAAAQGIRVFHDEVGICISRETKINGRIYAHAMEVSDKIALASPKDWQDHFDQLDCRFASLLAANGHISLPEKFRK